MKFAWAVVVLLPCIGHATPENWKVFKTHYGTSASSRIFKTDCSVCHIEAKFPARNGYGKALEAHQAADSRVITPADLTAIESEDSDGDGFSNAEEIQADFLPGDPKSHPAGKPKPAAAPKESTPTASESELIPRHSFHPAVVHFPIALFLFGVLLELWGARSKPEARIAAKYVLIGGAISTLLTLPTGLAVFLRSGFKWEGVALIHFILALVATALMVAVATLRAKAQQTSIGYWVLLLLAGAVVAAAGHFGGVLVYGS